MIELILFNTMQNCGKDSKPLTEKEKKDVKIAVAVAVAIWLILFVVAISRALKCSTANPDSRAIHFMFALGSPLLYIILSFSVPGFCRM